MRAASKAEEVREEFEEHPARKSDRERGKKDCFLIDFLVSKILKNNIVPVLWKSSLNQEQLLLSLVVE